MKNSKLLRYFKNSTPFIIVGALLMGVGFLIYWYSFEIWMIGTPVMIAGAALLVAGFILSVGDSAYLAYFTERADSARASVPHENAPDFTSDEFVFEGNSYARLDRSQRPCSELFVRTDIYFNKKTLEADCFRIDLAKDSVETERLEFPLSDLTASVEEREARVKGVLKKFSYMTLSAGERKLTFPVRYNDIEVDKLAERINEAKKHI